VIDGACDPVTVFAHGLTNSCYELAAFTPMLPGTKVRFCFRGHAHSDTPEPGHYRFADFASVNFLRHSVALSSLSVAS
jgi:hypothetical protein